MEFLVISAYLIAVCLLPGIIVPRSFRLDSSQADLWRWINKRICLPVGASLWFFAFTHHGVFDVRHGRTTENVQPYWGPVTAGIDWCETNYYWSPYIAEFWNSSTNIWMVIQGLCGAIACCQNGHPGRFTVAYILLSVIGVGSGWFHGTMTRSSQLGDELPMIWLLVALLYIFCVDYWGHALPAVLRYAGILYGCCCSVANVWSSNPLIFQVPFFALVFVMAIVLFQKLPEDRSEDVLRQLGWTCLFIASCAWTLERLTCQTLPLVEVLQLHSWWHVFIGMGVHMHIQAIAASAQRQNKTSTRIDSYLFGTMPVACSMNE